MEQVSSELPVTENIPLLRLPRYTPQIVPQEHIWGEIWVMSSLLREWSSRQVKARWRL
jgi:hypothetical protein